MHPIIHPPYVRTLTHTHPFTNPIHSPTPSIHPYIHSSTHPPAHRFTRSFIHPPIYSSTHPSPSILSIRISIYPRHPPSTHPSIHPYETACRAASECIPSLQRSESSSPTTGRLPVETQCNHKVLLQYMQHL